MVKLLERHSLRIYTAAVGLLFLYSFTQIDLGLALTRFPWLFSIQRAFQSIGYFNRPLSTGLFILILTLLSVSYFFMLSFVRKKKIERKSIWKYICVVTALLTLSYNAFSYDLFNYIFDAKIVTHYQQNPYEHKALDYPNDPMLGFMHWTHRVYPYGPLWLALTVPLSFVGLNIFLVTFFLFKVFIAACYLGSIYFIEKIAEKMGSKHPLIPVVFFAFNPLVVIECLVSAHNDIVMLFFALAGIYLLFSNKYILSIVLVACSIATKYATVFLLPVYLSLLVLQYLKLKTSWVAIWFTAIGCMVLAVLAASRTSGNFQPWYALYILPFAALLSENKAVSIITGIVSIVIAATYIPFLYTGNWDKPIPQILMWIYITTICLVVLLSFGFFLTSRKKQT